MEWKHFNRRNQRRWWQWRWVEPLMFNKLKRFTQRTEWMRRVRTMSIKLLNESVYHIWLQRWWWWDDDAREYIASKSMNYTHMGGWGSFTNEFRVYLRNTFKNWIINRSITEGEGYSRPNRHQNRDWKRPGSTQDWTREFSLSSRVHPLNGGTKNGRSIED